MSDLVLGKNVTVTMLIGSEYLPLFCAKSMGFSYDQEAIESTTNTSGFDRTYEVGLGTAKLNLTGITKTSDITKVGPFYLFQQSVRRQKQSIRLVFNAQDASVKTITFTALIIRNGFTSDILSWAQCSIDFQISGPVDIGDVIPIPSGGGGSGGSGSSGGGSSSGTTDIVLSDWWNTTNGNNSIEGLSSGETDGTNYTLVITDTILIVFVEGLQFSIVMGTPTPGQRECSLDLINNRIIFPSDLIFDGSQTVTVVWER